MVKTENLGMKDAFRLAAVAVVFFILGVFAFWQYSSRVNMYPIADIDGAVGELDCECEIPSNITVYMPIGYYLNCKRAVVRLNESISTVRCRVIETSESQCA